MIIVIVITTIIIFVIIFIVTIIVFVIIIIVIIIDNMATVVVIIIVITIVSRVSPSSSTVLWLSSLFPHCWRLRSPLTRRTSRATETACAGSRWVRTASGGATGCCPARRRTCCWWRPAGWWRNRENRATWHQAATRLTAEKQPPKNKARTAVRRRRPELHRRASELHRGRPVLHRRASELHRGRPELHRRAPELHRKKKKTATTNRLFLLSRTLRSFWKSNMRRVRRLPPRKLLEALEARATRRLCLRLPRKSRTKTRRLFPRVRMCRRLPISERARRVHQGVLCMFSLPVVSKCVGIWLISCSSKVSPLENCKATQSTCCLVLERVSDATRIRAEWTEYSAGFFRRTYGKLVILFWRKLLVRVVSLQLATLSPKWTGLFISRVVAEDELALVAPQSQFPKISWSCFWAWLAHCTADTRIWSCNICQSQEGFQYMVLLWQRRGYWEIDDVPREARSSRKRPAVFSQEPHAHNQEHVSQVGAGACQPRAEHIPTTYRPHTDHIPTTSQPHTNYMPATNRPHTDHIPTTCQPQIDHIPTTYQTTCRPHTDQINFTITFMLNVWPYITEIVFVPSVITPT